MLSCAARNAGGGVLYVNTNAHWQARGPDKTQLRVIPEPLCRNVDTTLLTPTHGYPIHYLGSPGVPRIPHPMNVPQRILPNPANHHRPTPGQSHASSCQCRGVYNVVTWIVPKGWAGHICDWSQDVVQACRRATGFTTVNVTFRAIDYHNK